MGGSAEGLSGALAAVVRLRIAAGLLTIAMLVRRTVISQGHLSNWLHGRRSLSPKLCDSVLVALRLSAADVLSGNVPAPERRLCPVVVMPLEGDPRRVPAAAVHVTPAWRRVSGLQRVVGV